MIRDSSIWTDSLVRGNHLNSNTLCLEVSSRYLQVYFCDGDNRRRCCASCQKTPFASGRRKTARTCSLESRDSLTTTTATVVTRELTQPASVHIPEHIRSLFPVLLLRGQRKTNKFGFNKLNSMLGPILLCAMLLCR